MGELLISSAAGKHQAHRPAQLSYYTKLKSRAHLGGKCSALQPDPNAGPPLSPHSRKCPPPPHK